MYGRPLGQQTEVDYGYDFGRIAIMLASGTVPCA